MKKVQRAFAIEYRSGRRKLDSKSNSIWGDMDLKSVAHDLLKEAMPLLPEGPQGSKSGGDISCPGEQPAATLLTPPIVQETNASALEETTMADENTTLNDADAPTAAAPDLPKKERKPRARKGVPETAANDTVGRQKRGRKQKSDEGAASVKLAPVKRGAKNVLTASAPSVAAVDEITDLLQLEEENQRLRKLLAEKLRAENADLRKRLNLG